MMKFVYLLSILLFLSCSVASVSVHPENTVVSDTLSGSPQLEELIGPFRDTLKVEMGEVIAYSETDLIVKRPSSNLMNWVADAVFADQTKNKRLGEPTFCLLNTGGIRSMISKGDITLGDLYKLMPFDNEIVWVKLPVSVIPQIELFMKKTGGEPISNAKISSGKLEINGMRPGSAFFWVITSDYLMNGGDKMDFFKEKVDVMTTGRLLRDALISEAKDAGTLIADTTIRITF